MKPATASVVWGACSLAAGTEVLDIETKALVQRWILTFCEAPVLVDAELMRRVLDEADAEAEDRRLPSRSRASG